MADEDATLDEVGEDPGASPPAPPSGPLPEVAVAAVGLTIHALPSLRRLFASATPGGGLAWVVVPRQSEAISLSDIVEALGPLKGLTVEGVVDELEPQADHIYVAPPDLLATFAEGRLRLAPADNVGGERGAIDSFFVTLAEANTRAAIGVVLTEVGREGTAGVQALKKCGGLLISERDETGGGEDAHPLASPRGLADFVLPPEEIAPRVEAYLAHLRQSHAVQDEAAANAEIADQITRVAAVLRNRTGHDFHGYKHKTFMRRIQRRMQVNAIDAVDGYIDYLKEDADEVQHLFQDLLIGVTQFFRDKPEFDFLQREVVPRLFEGKGAGDQVRVWVLGCATGEEAYSIAMLLREHMDTLDAVPHVQIFATDIDGRALTVARSGRYPESVAKDVSPERLARWFSREGVTYCVNKDLREMCIFSQHNVTKDAPFSRIDLCSCRNLLIYLTSALQDRVIPLFHFALRGEGYLFLGSSENVTRHARLFTPVDRQRRIFRRMDTGPRVLPHFPLNFADRARGALYRRPIPTHPSGEGQLGRVAERIAERYAPAHVLVDPRYEILSFSGRTGRYLEPSPGAANLNVESLVHRDLRIDLRAALQRAHLDRRTAKVERVLLSDGDDEPRRVDLIVEPLPGEEPPGYLVLFREAARNDGAEEPGVVAAVLRDEHVIRLEGELLQFKERLQATIEELESTNEELKSSNEEYQSINEELQNANEELETSKEELQSVNEELHTVNSELAQRVGELSRANSDLKNLLESTQIATLFLDNDLRVKGFTPAISDLFHLIDSDIGRPLAHIASKIAFPELQDDVRRVLRTLSTVEREIGPPQGPRYHVRVLPYRSVENYIAGAVLTFLDVTEATRAAADLARSEARFRAIAELVPELLWSVDGDGSADWFSQRWTDYSGQPINLALGWGWLDALHPDDREETRAALEAARLSETPFRREHRMRGVGGEYRWFLANAAPVRLEDSRLRYFGAATDIHAFKQADDRYRLMVAELQHRVKNILAIVRSISTRSLETSETLDQFAAHFAGRLDALARTQVMISRQGDQGVQLDSLVWDELAASAPNGDGHIEVSGPSVLLKEKAAEVFALALHELATNAVKYGALSVPKGRLDVEWRLMNTREGQRLSLEWRESGVPILDSRPVKSGFGRDLIEYALPYDLDAVTSLDFAPGGVRCTVELPLSDRVVASDVTTVS